MQYNAFTNVELIRALSGSSFLPEEANELIQLLVTRLDITTQTESDLHELAGAIASEIHDDLSNSLDQIKFQVQEIEDNIETESLQEYIFNKLEEKIHG